MKKKLLSLALAGTMAASTMAVGAVNAAAYVDYDGSGLVPGWYCDHPTYTPSSTSIKTNRLMFAMPGAWKNAITRVDKNGGLCGAYWWSGYDTPGSQGWSHGWPGWQAEKVDESDVNNLWAIDVPSYGNGEVGNAAMLIWNNFIDGGTEKDPSKNPFYKAAQQTRDSQCQYYSRYDKNKTYDILFRYIYMKAFEKAGVDGISPLDIKSDNFWVEANKLCAVFNGEKWDRLTNDEKTFQVDIVLDDYAPDLSEFDDYESNFFNEDLVGADGIYYKAEEPNGYGESFTFDNMVFVVNFDPDKMVQAPQGGRIAYDGDWYFYYGSGDYGSWPTKELNEQMGGVKGNFTGKYAESPEDYPIITDPINTDTSNPVDPYANPKYQAPNWVQDKYDSSIYFYANPFLFGRNFKYIYMYLYDHNNGEIINWGSKKGKMTNEGNGIWSFDLDAKGITLDPYKAYGVIFTADLGLQTCDLIIGSDCLGDIAYCPGSDEENNVDSSKKSRIVKWANVDSSKYGNPKCITAIGNVIGNAYWPGDTGYSMFVSFLSDTGKMGIDNALKFNGKTEQQTIDDTAKALGLSENDIKRAIEASGRSFKWVPLSKPAAPYLMFTQSSNGDLAVHWNDVYGAVKYILYYRPTGTKKWSSASTTNTMYSLNFLPSGTTYDIQVQSIGANNTKGYYSFVSSLDIPHRSPELEKPAAPTVTLANKSNGIRAEWKAVSGATKYIVYYKKNSDSKWNSTETANTYYPLLNLTAGTQYAVQVQAIGKNNVKGYYSAVKRLVYIPQVKPTVTLANKSNGIRAEWKAVSGATGYTVYYKKDADSKWNSVETANTYYPLLNIKPGVKYAVQVQPKFNTAAGLYSAVARLVYVPQVKPAVTLANKSNGIRAEWKAVPGATKYIVYYKKDSDSKWNSVETANTYYPLLKLTAGTKYAVQVQPVTNGVKGMYSSVSRLVYIPQVKPALTLSNKSNGIRAEWKTVAGATKYIVYFKKNSDSKWNSVETTKTYYPLLKLTVGTYYAVQVQAVFGNTKGMYSSVARLTYKPAK